MLVPRFCPMCGGISIKELDVTEQQLFQYGSGRKLIQEVFPNLSAEDREFIKSGYCESCMEKLFSFEEV